MPAHAISTPTPTAAEDYEGVKDFARGCMRTYLMLKDKAAKFNADKEIQAILAEIKVEDPAMKALPWKIHQRKSKSLESAEL